MAGARSSVSGEEENAQVSERVSAAGLINRIPSNAKGKATRECTAMRLRLYFALVK